MINIKCRTGIQDNDMMQTPLYYNNYDYQKDETIVWLSEGSLQNVMWDHQGKECGIIQR